MISVLTKGMNLWGYQGSVNMEVGESQAQQDILPVNDGSIQKHWGWRRIDATAQANPIYATKGFSYKGKNNNPAVNPARPGNFGIADDAGGIFTRRMAFYSTGIILSDSGLYYWDPAAGPPAAFAGPVALPGGVAIVAGGDPKPTIVVLNNNAYIVGWADANLRYDPVDRALYEWGFAAVPANAGHTGLQAGGTLVADAVYRYRLSWVDLYTGEESALSAEYVVNTTAVNRTVLLDNFIAYAGARHFIDGGNLTNNDVGVVVYRTGPDQQTYYFLGIVNPGLAAGTLTDNGLATDMSLKADTRAFQDPPRLNTMTEFRGQWYGISYDTNWNRIYYNDFRSENSFYERNDVRDYIELPLQEGEYLTAISKTEQNLVAFTNMDAYEVGVRPNLTTGRVDRNIVPQRWSTGCVGPKAWDFIEGGLYWLSDRGPYRYKGGQIQFIGKNVAPMFIDPQSGLCQLNAESRQRAEVLYDKDADTVRFSFGCGGAYWNNRHIYWWLRGPENGLKYWQGWSYGSTAMQAMDRSHVYEELVGGAPITPQDKRERYIFSDADGFLYEYDPARERGGYDPANPATGVADATSTIWVLVTAGGLPVAGSGLDGLRLEVVYADGTIDVRTITANTATNITPDAPFTQAPAVTSIWYIGGIPAYWRSWFDHGGEPTQHKSWIHHFTGFNRTMILGDQVVDIEFYAGDFPQLLSLARTAALTTWRSKLLVSLTARFFAWEVANSRPDEPFAITYFKNVYQPAGERQSSG